MIGMIGHVKSSTAMRLSEICDGAGGATDTKEPANDFLAGSDFGKGAIPARVQVDLESLVVGVQFLVVHQASGSMIWAMHSSGVGEVGVRG